MTELVSNIEAWRGWIGREDRASDVITPELVRRFHATLGLVGEAQAGAIAPALIHWCLAQPAVPAEGLGSDGHPRKGGFLPPIELPRRMWAGSEIQFSGKLRVGDTVERMSRITDVTEKTGRTGRLCFVTVRHEVSANNALVLTERQDIVYREAATDAAIPVREAADMGDVRAEVLASPLLLFRYSALTFNGHRIHYDRPYATAVEHYPGLVVHGPLQATLLFNLAAHHHGSRPSRFSFRGLSPLPEGPMMLNARASDTGMALWMAAPGGPVAMQAEAIWS